MGSKSEISWTDATWNPVSVPPSHQEAEEEREQSGARGALGTPTNTGAGNPGGGRAATSPLGPPLSPDDSDQFELEVKP
jgi:hypothetical protein